MATASETGRGSLLTCHVAMTCNQSKLLISKIALHDLKGKLIFLSASPWDRGQIGTKLGRKHVTYQKLDNFL